MGVDFHGYGHLAFIIDKFEYQALQLLCFEGDIES